MFDDLGIVHELPDVWVFESHVLIIHGLQHLAQNVLIGLLLISARTTTIMVVFCKSIFEIPHLKMIHYLSDRLISANLVDVVRLLPFRHEAVTV